MQISLVMKTARSATFLLDDGGIYHTKKEYKILLNNKEIKTTDTVVTSVFDLKPDTDYEIKVTHAEEVVAAAEFTTDYEYVTLDVKKFGAKGDGISDDTGFIQAAIMACPPKSRVLIPKGVYRITSIFLKSGLNLEIAKGAELKAETDRDRFAKFPGLIESYDEMVYRTRSASYRKSIGVPLGSPNLSRVVSGRNNAGNTSRLACYTSKRCLPRRYS